MPDSVVDVLHALAHSEHAETFREARCAGRWRLFDPPRIRERSGLWHERAEACRWICTSCPVFEACSSIAAELPRSQREHQTYAAITYDERGNPKFIGVTLPHTRVTEENQ